MRKPRYEVDYESVQTIIQVLGELLDGIVHLRIYDESYPEKPKSVPEKPKRHSKKIDRKSSV